MLFFLRHKDTIFFTVMDLKNSKMSHCYTNKDWLYFFVVFNLIYNPGIIPEMKR